MDAFFAAITLNGLVGFVLTVIVIGAICWLLVKAIELSGIPEHLAKFGRGFVWVAGIFILIYALLGFAGIGGVQPLVRF